MKLEYKKLEIGDENLLMERNLVYEKLIKNIIPTEKELDVLMMFERKYRVCNACKKGITEGVLIYAATVKIKGEMIKIGYFKECLSCELKNSL